MLAHLGDAWDELDSTTEETPTGDARGRPDETGQDLRNRVQAVCLQKNYELGVLPI
jgi:hypothetical protein